MGAYSNDYSPKWWELPSNDANRFRSVSGVVGTSTTVATSCLPAGHQKMAGLQSAYYSGYSASTCVAEGVTAIGELVLIREVVFASQHRAYAYPVGYSDSRICLGAQFKDFDGHHFPNTETLPTNGVFGKIPLRPDLEDSR